MPLPYDEFDISAYHSRQAAKYLDAFESERKFIKMVLTEPLEARGIDTRAMHPEKMLAVAAALLGVR